LIVQVAVVPILLFALTLLAFFIEGKGTLPNRARTLAIGLLLGLCGDVLVYGSIFSWKIIEVTYLDHQHLVSTIRRLHDELVAKQRPVAEPVNSLRRRIIRLADELDSFDAMRNAKCRALQSPLI
jgi:hypothetical protein